MSTWHSHIGCGVSSESSLSRQFSWQCQNFCLLSLAFIIDWGVVRRFWDEKAPFMGPRLATCIAYGTTEAHGQHQMCLIRRGGPKTPPREQVMQSSIVCWKTHSCLNWSLIMKSQQNWVGDQTWESAVGGQEAGGQIRGGQKGHGPEKASEAGWPQGHVQAGRPQDEKGQYGKEGQSHD